MKAILINGSPNKDGTTNRALEEVSNTLLKEGINTTIIQLGNETISDCIACKYCYKEDKCVFNDKVNEVLELLKDADALIVGSPVYYAHPSGRILSFLDRLFYAGSNFEHKVAASIVCARRAGTSASLDVINKHFLISGMYVVGSTYWNMLHGNNKTEAENDLEGLQTLRNLGLNIAYLVKSLKNSNIEKPVLKREYRTNFIR